MAKLFSEPLEPRCLFATTAVPAPTPVAGSTALTTTQVQTILAQAVSQAMAPSAKTPGQVAAVVDREGTVLGILAAPGFDATSAAGQIVVGDAVARARTAAFFQSSGEAFTTRTARFIIQDHFPAPINNTEGGPLYGVEFSSLPGSNVLAPSSEPAVSGDPGGIPLYVGKVPVGGIGVAGDGSDIAIRSDLLPTTTPAYNPNPKRKVFNGSEEHDYDEAVALAGAKGFMAPVGIRATKIFVNGLRFPFTVDSAAHKNSTKTFASLTAGGAPIVTAVTAGTPELSNATFAGVNGLLRQHDNYLHNPDGSDVLDSSGNPVIDPNLDAQTTMGLSDATDGLPTGTGLTSSDVSTIISNAVETALHTRAGIRKPNGVNAVVHVVVVDLKGNVLGAFRMNDGTNFSYDVAVQKARTALFFSDDSHAFSTRAIGFMAQKYFPPGIQKRLTGPLYHLQNDLAAASPGVQAQLTAVGLGNGITVFPGGVPLYRNGKLIGAIGVSGDGVDQDDRIAYGGTLGFRPDGNIRSDALPAADIISFIKSKVQVLNNLGVFAAAGDPEFITRADENYKGLFDLRLPYVKFPRNPEI